MKLYDLIKVTDESILGFFGLLIEPNTVGRVISLASDVDEDYYKIQFGERSLSLPEDVCEVVYDEKDRKYSYELWKTYMLKRHDDLTVALLINMGGGDCYNDGKTAEYMREHGRIVIPEWYYYDTDLI